MHSTTRITIDLAALAANYAQLRTLARNSEVAAVVKANAYGLGVAPVTSRLISAGCRTFFVATVAEGVEVRALHPATRIFVLGGLQVGSLADFARYRLLPVLNTVAEVDTWARQLAGAPAALQIDTGMTRAGLSADEAEALGLDTNRRGALNLALILSHFACADEPARAMNLEQLERFERLRRHWPGIPWSLANSAGTFLGPRYHGDLVRPGIALFGGRPQASGVNPMSEVVRLQGRVLQVRAVREAVSVGYGATMRILPPARIATIGVGYADGYPRALSARGYASQNGHRAPLVGRISMDLLTVDVSEAVHDELLVGDYVDLIGGGAPLEEVASLAGTVNYELLTSLSRRAEWIYH